MQDMMSLLGRFYIKLAEVIKNDPTAIPQLDGYAVTDVDRVRAAVVVAELADAETAIERLGALADDPGVNAAVRTDAALLARVYGEGAAAIGPEERERLDTHHGYFARVALTFNDPAGSADRAALRSGGAALVGGLVMIGVVMLLAVLGGFGLFIMGITLVATGKIRPAMPIPERGGSVFIETFAVFVVGFLAVQGVAGLMAVFAGNEAAWVLPATLGMQWLLILTPLWPLLRGVRWSRLRGALGLTSGRGVLTEIGMGVLGYLAGIPLFIAGVLVSFMLMILAQAIRLGLGMGEPPLPENALFDLVGQGGWVTVLFASLVVLWAPLCEETIFRGALFRALRGRVGVVLSVLACACVFGFMHGYGPLLVFPLIALGSVFCLLREWRGSLIAPITAHMLHNGTVLVMILFLMTVLGD
jgi:membrane protease YdiL (CAAX protease family)